MSVSVVESGYIGARGEVVEGYLSIAAAEVNTLNIDSLASQVSQCTMHNA